MAENDIRTEIADLKRQLDDLRIESSANFGQVAVAIRRTRQQVLSNELSQSVRRLRPPTTLVDWTPRQGRAADPALEDSLIDRLRKGEAVGNSMGNDEPDIGQANLLEYPEFTNYDFSIALTSSFQAVAPGWQARYTLNSGTAPANIHFSSWPRSYIQYNPLNSGMPQVTSNPTTAACDIEVDVRSTTATTPQVHSFTNVYLVASARIINHYDLSAGWASATASVQLIKVSDGSVAASSAPLDILTLGEDEVRRIHTALFDSDFYLDGYWWQVHFHLVKTNGTSDLFGGSFGEPQLHYAYSPDPISYSPRIAKWVPDTVYARFGADGYTSMRLDRDGLHLGGGTAAEDVDLYWGGADVLKTDDTFSIGTGGFLRTGNTSFPGSPSTGDRFWRTDLGMDFYYDGTRWLSTQLFTVPFEHSDALNPFSAAGATTDPLRLGAPGLVGSDIWLVSITSQAYIGAGTAPDASNKWVIDYRKFNVDGTPTTMTTHTINSGASSDWRTGTQTIGALLNNGTTHYSFGTVLTKTGAIGNLYLQPLLNYRHVAT